MMDFRWKTAPTLVVKKGKSYFDGLEMALQFREEIDGKWSDWITVPVVPYTQDEFDDAMRDGCK
jgi:hypothetical protein